MLYIQLLIIFPLLSFFTPKFQPVTNCHDNASLLHLRQLFPNTTKDVTIDVVINNVICIN